VARKHNGPLVLGVKDLVHQPGEMREVTLTVDAPEKYGEAMAVVPQGTPLEISLRLEGLHEGILATGEVSVLAVAECVRCLDSFPMGLQVDFQELFAYSQGQADSYTVVDDSLDLGDIIRDAVVLDLPFQPVCKPDCFGLDPETGEKRTEPWSEKDTEAIDPRWQALSELLESDPPETTK
jgi:uncharacterized protein